MPVVPSNLPPDPRGGDFGHCPQVGSAPGPHPFGGEGSNACLRRDEPQMCGRPKKSPKARVGKRSRCDSRWRCRRRRFRRRPNKGPDARATRYPLAMGAVFDRPSRDTHLNGVPLLPYAVAPISECLHTPGSAPVSVRSRTDRHPEHQERCTELRYNRRLPRSGQSTIQA